MTSPLITILLLSIVPTVISENDLCQAVRLAENSNHELRRIVDQVQHEVGLAELMNQTLAAVKDQFRVQSLPFAILVRSVITSRDFQSATSDQVQRCLETITYSEYIRPNNITNEPLYSTPAFEMMKSNYAAKHMRLFQIEHNRDYMLRFHSRYGYDSFVQECRQSNAEQVLFWIYDQTVGPSTNLLTLLRATLRGKDNARTRYRDWAWAILTGFHRAAYLTQICATVEVDGVVPSDEEIRREADGHWTKLAEVFDGLIETEKEIY